MNYLETEGELAGDRPGAAADEGVGAADAAHDVDEEADAVVGGVLGEDVAGVGDGDPAAAALGEVDVVDAGAVGDDELHRRELEEELRRDPRDDRLAEDGARGLRVVAEVFVERQWGFVGFEHVEFGEEFLLEDFEEEAGAEDEEVGEVAAGERRAGAVEVVVEAVGLGVYFLTHFCVEELNGMVWFGL